LAEAATGPSSKNWDSPLQRPHDGGAGPGWGLGPLLGGGDPLEVSKTTAKSLLAGAPIRRVVETRSTDIDARSHGCGRNINPGPGAREEPSFGRYRPAEDGGVSGRGRTSENDSPRSAHNRPLTSRDVAYYSSGAPDGVPTSDGPTGRSPRRVTRCMTRRFPA
jgi:hypothetical protein